MKTPSLAGFHPFLNSPIEGGQGAILERVVVAHGHAPPVRQLRFRQAPDALVKIGDSLGVPQQYHLLLAIQRRWPLRQQRVGQFLQMLVRSRTRRLLVAQQGAVRGIDVRINDCLLYTSPSPRDRTRSRMPSSA